MAGELRVLLFGPLRVERDGQELPDSAWRSRHERRLFTALVAARGATLPVSLLIEWLWPASDPERAAITLRAAVSSLRATLEPHAGRASKRYILTQSGGYAWNTHGGAWIDIEVFIALLEAPDAERDEAAMAQAVALYRGDVLQDDPDAPWAAPLRERLREQFLVTVERLAAARVRERAYADAAALARRGIEHDRLREPLYRIQMQAAALSGDVAAALQSYERFRLLLDYELGAAPAPATQALHTAILRGEVGNTSEPPSGDVGIRPRPRGPRPAAPPHPGETPLVGRDGELAQVRSWLSALGQRRGATIAVVGEAGIGKTHLLHAIQREALARGCQLITLRCELIERGQPFAALTEALRPLIRHAPDALLKRLPRAAMAQAAELMPVLRERVPDLPELPPLGAADTRTRVADGLIELALALSRFAPLVICCDDAQWADEAVLAMVGRLARAAPRYALLIVLAYRADEVTDNQALHELVRALSREMMLRSLLLGNLDEPQIAAWLGHQSRTRPDALAHLAGQVYQRSGGNPLVAQVLVQSLLDAHGASSLATLLPLLDQHEPLPDPARSTEVRNMISARLERLQPGVRLLAEQLALLGRAASLDLIEQLGGEDALVAAQILLDRQFLVEAPDGSLSFAHDLVRDAIVTLTGGPRRRLLHRQIAQALEHRHGARPEYAAEILQHLQGGGRNADARVARYALAAGTYAMHHLGYDEARRFFTIAVQAAEQLGEQAPAELVRQAQEGKARAEQALREVTQS